jgi:hypothetical protein
VPVKVRVDLAYKINMGNYETLSVGYGLEADALEGENASEAFKRVEDFVSTKLFNEVERIKKTL